MQRHLNGLEYMVKMKGHCLIYLSHCFHVCWQKQLLILAHSWKVQSIVVRKSQWLVTFHQQPGNREQWMCVLGSFFLLCRHNTSTRRGAGPSFTVDLSIPVNPIKISLISIPRDQCHLNYLLRVCLEIWPLGTLDPSKWTINTNHHRQWRLWRIVLRNYVRWKIFLISYM